KVFVLGLLCLVQSLLLLVLVGLKSGYPSEGIILPAPLEMYISLVLTSVGGLMMGLAISATAPNTDRAMSIVPLIFIPQIIFAGNTFKLTSATEWISYIIVTRWGLVALGSTVGLHSNVCPPNLTDPPCGVDPRNGQQIASFNPTQTPDGFY